MGRAASELLDACISHKIFAFYGDMGAGKTTLIKAICRQLGAADNFSSPSYAIVNEYRHANDQPLYHIDLYRLTSLEEAEEIGVEEYLNSGHYCFVEWPQIIEPLLPEDTVKLALEVQKDDARKLTIKR